MSNRITHWPHAPRKEFTEQQTASVVGCEFDQGRNWFLRRYIAFISDPATPSDVKSDCVAGTISAIRQIAQLNEVAYE